MKTDKVIFHSCCLCLFVFRVLCHYLGSRLMIINSQKCPLKWWLWIFFILI